MNHKVKDRRLVNSYPMYDKQLATEQKDEIDRIFRVEGTEREMFDRLAKKSLNSC